MKVCIALHCTPIVSLDIAISRYDLSRKVKPSLFLEICIVCLLFFCIYYASDQNRNTYIIFITENPEDYPYALRRG